jgi:hypothetical protein
MSMSPEAIYTGRRAAVGLGALTSADKEGNKSTLFVNKRPCFIAELKGFNRYLPV